MVSLDRRLVRPGATLAWSDSEGPGPVVVLVHGAGMDHRMFDDQAEGLHDAGYRVLLCDLRGHGSSSLGRRFAAADALDDLIALLDAAEVSSAVLVGHSLGGNLVQELARRHPDRVTGLVVMDATWNTGPLTRLERLALRAAAPALRAIPAAALPRLMARASAVSPEAVALTQATFERMPKPTFVDVWRATVSFVHPEPAHRTPVPLALIRGARDRTGNIATAMPRWARAEGVHERVVPDAGHIVTWDAPGASTRALLDALTALGP